MCDEMEYAHICVPLSFPLSSKFLLLFLLHWCEPDLSERLGVTSINI